MLGHKKKPKKIKRIEIVQSMYFNHKVVILEIDNKKKFGKFTNIGN